MKRTILTMALVTAIVPIAGCGSSSSGGSPAASSSAASTSASSGAQAQITANWEAFFSPNTSLQRSVQILQNGKQFESALRGQAGSSLAKQASAKVTKVELTSPTRATVTFSILLGGQPVLQGQQGIALKVNGVWQVSDQSFCSLLQLQGKPPPACAAVH